MGIKQLNIIVIVVCLGLLAGCERSEHKDLQVYIDNLRKDEVVKQKKVITDKGVPTPETTIYKAGNLRPPFSQAGALPDARATTSNPLQKYPLNMLRFVGTITKNNVIYAYIIAPDGMVYQVKEGDLIGDRYGKVVTIEQYQLNVKEESSENGKPSMQRLITLQLKDNR